MSGLVTSNDKLYIYTKDLIELFWEFKECAFKDYEDDDFLELYGHELDRVQGHINFVIFKKIGPLLIDVDVNGRLQTIARLIVETIMDFLNTNQLEGIEYIESQISVLEQLLDNAANNFKS